MSAKLATNVARDLQSLFTLGLVAGRTDGQLLETFRSGSGGSAEAAFEALVTRHGPMVLRVCRRVLNDEHDAQAAFQATFLLLVRKAGTVRNQASVASWLHGVAHRVSWRAKVAAARRRTHERRRAVTVPESRLEPIDSDAGQVAIDEEIRRLPEKYRAPIVLCYLEGLTQERASEHLGWPAGTVRGRLARARDLLRARLSRRGVELPPASLALGIMPAAEMPSALPAGLLGSTASAAMRTANIPSAVAALLKWETVARLKLIVVLLGIGGLTAGGALVATRLPAVVRAPGTMIPPRVPLAEALALPAAIETPRADGPDRTPAAIARPLSGIIIDGKLGDWPKSLTRYPIANNLAPPSRRVGEYGRGNEQAASFTVGYDPVDQRVYLAVVVEDDQNVIDNVNGFLTDALEIFVDGLRTDRKIPSPSGEWWNELRASKMPALQYVAIPGKGRAYADPNGHNPSLMYGDASKTRTLTAWTHKDGVTTYECAIQVFDHYPDQPTRLMPGKRIGFDVAVVDKDSSGLPSSYVTWGAAPTAMKGLDAGQLGDLILAGP